MRVFLGITGASGAPYAARLLRALVSAGCEVGICASGSGVEVLATELYGDARLSRDEVLARFTEGVASSVTLYDERDWRSPYASGSARVDAYVICPCSMSTVGTIASGAMLNLMPRETPLSLIHLETMATLKRAGATLLFLAPGFYGGAESVGDLVDFMVSRCLDQLGLENVLARRWGQ